MKQSIYLILIFVLTSCGASGPKYIKQNVSDSSKGIVYFYRPSRFFQGGGGPDVFINGVKEFRMHNGSYTYRMLSPGTYSISPRKHFNWGLDVVDTAITIEAGKEYYLRMDFSNANVDGMIVGGIGVATVSGVTIFNIIEKSLAESEITKTQLVQ